MDFVLEGTVVPLAKGDPTNTFDGRVYVPEPTAEAGTIAGVSAGAQNAPPGFDAAPVVDVGNAFIYPGLIDLHSHIGYNSLKLWSDPDETEPYQHHDIWPRRHSYKPEVSWPAWVLAKAAPEALLTYVQVQAMAGGTTSIQGWPNVNRHPANYLIRNIDDQRFGGQDRTRTSALTLDQDQLRDRAQILDDGLGFIYHCSEGRVGSKVVEEFDDVAAAGCLRQGLIAIHCNAVGDAEFARWEARAELAGDPRPGTVVWSPFSNLWLYNETTAIPAARAHGLNVCLGTDWAPSGTKNLLGELKVARLWSDKKGWGLTDFDLVSMVTSSPGDALARCWEIQVGRLEADALADIAVVHKRSADPWTNLVRAREEDVLLVVVDGLPRYGTKDLMSACGATRTTSVKLGPARRRTVLINPADEGQAHPRPWTWNKVLAALKAVRKAAKEDLQGIVNDALAALAGVGPVPEPMGRQESPLILDLDMPGGLGMVAGPPPAGVEVTIPETPSLRHDRNWRSDVKRGGFHEGFLDNLDSFYS